MYMELFRDILIGEGDTRELSGGGPEVARKAKRSEVISSIVAEARENRENLRNIISRKNDKCILHVSSLFVSVSGD